MGERFAVIEGVATEVSTIGLAQAVAAAGLVVHRQLDWRRLYPVLVVTASLSGSVLLIIRTATAMAWALTQSDISSRPAAAMTVVPGGKPSFPAISIRDFAVLGSVLRRHSGDRAIRAVAFSGVARAPRP